VKFFPNRDVRVVTFATWEEGLVVATRNPKSISGVEDLARPDVEIINRETGAGARLLLDTSLRKNGIPHGRVRGYDQTASGQVMAAWHVHSGKADCCIATRGSARVFGLHFIPLAVERYDLVIPSRYMDEPSVQSVLDALGRSSFRHELEALGGYDTSETGRMVL
jgi:molybdate-binding protein